MFSPRKEWDPDTDLFTRWQNPVDVGTWKSCRSPDMNYESGHLNENLSTAAVRAYYMQGSRAKRVRMARVAAQVAAHCLRCDCVATSQSHLRSRISDSDDWHPCGLVSTRASHCPSSGLARHCFLPHLVLALTRTWIALLTCVLIGTRRCRHGSET